MAGRAGAVYQSDAAPRQLRDNVLYLQQSLNAMAIASLRGELDTLIDDVERLIQVM